MPKYTPWFSGDVKPVRDGVYQRRYSHRAIEESVVFCMFKGGQWFCWATTAEEAECTFVPSFWQAVEWRGLTKEAKHA